MLSLIIFKDLHFIYSIGLYSIKQLHKKWAHNNLLKSLPPLKISINSLLKGSPTSSFNLHDGEFFFLKRIKSFKTNENMPFMKEAKN